jgi:hypothetical protein
MYVDNEYWAKHRRVVFNTAEHVLSRNLIPSAMSSASRQLRFDPFDLSSVDEKYILHTFLAQTTPRGSYRAACMLTVARLDSN